MLGPFHKVPSVNTSILPPPCQPLPTSSQSPWLHAMLYFDTPGRGNLQESLHLPPFFLQPREEQSSTSDRQTGPFCMAAAGRTLFLCPITFSRPCYPSFTLQKCSPKQKPPLRSVTWGPGPEIPSRGRCHADTQARSHLGRDHISFHPRGGEY